MFIFKAEIANFAGNILERYFIGAQDAVEAGACARLLYESEKAEGEAAVIEDARVEWVTERDRLLKQGVLPENCPEFEEPEFDDEPYLIGNVTCVCKLSAIANNVGVRVSQPVQEEDGPLSEELLRDIKPGGTA